MGGPGAMHPPAGDEETMAALPLALLVPSLPGKEGRVAVAGETARLLSKRWYVCTPSPSPSPVPPPSQGTDPSCPCPPPPVLAAATSRAPRRA